MMPRVGGFGKGSQVTLETVVSRGYWEESRLQRLKEWHAWAREGSDTAEWLKKAEELVELLLCVEG